MTIDKKYFILLSIIGGFLLIFLILIAVKLSTRSKAAEKAESTIAISAPTANTVDAFFSPSQISTMSGSTITASIILKGSQVISGTQIVLKYDPAVVYNVKINPPSDRESVFGDSKSYKVRTNKIDQKSGIITYVVTTTKLSNKKVGQAAILTFRATKKASISAALITFMPNTVIKTPGTKNSILNSANPLVIILK